MHDDLPALDDDEERRGQPSTWKRFGEATGILAGDALLAEAFRLATSYDTPHVARELSQATLGMIGGQYLDITGTAPDEVTLHKLKTGCLFEASVGLALWVAEIPEAEQAPWRAFADELGLLFQIVDDILDGDGYVVVHGVDGARRLADEAADRARDASRRDRRRHVDPARDRRRPRRADGVIPPSGEQYDLSFGAQRATVVEVGGGLRTYAVAGREVLDGYGIDERCRSARGQVLAPWPNRITGGEYSFDGEDYRLALTEPAAGNAIHGLVRWENWDRRGA